MQEGLNNNFLRLFFFVRFYHCAASTDNSFDALHLSAVSSVGGEREKKEVNLFNSLVIYGWAAIGLCEISFFIYNLLPWTVHTTEARKKFQLSSFFILYICIQSRW